MLPLVSDPQGIMNIPEIWFYQFPFMNEDSMTNKRQYDHGQWPEAKQYHDIKSETAETALMTFSCNL